jgi:hypothetical protein
MFSTIVGAGAGAASRYGSGSDQKMRLLAAPAPQHWFSSNGEHYVGEGEELNLRCGTCLDLLSKFDNQQT